MIKDLLAQSLSELANLLSKMPALAEPLQKLADAMLQAWQAGRKTLIAGNGGSAADAMHLAEELVVRFARNRRALAAIALTDPTIITCCANDFDFDRVFSRQVEALGNPGDILIVMSTSGNSVNLIRAIESAKSRGMTTAGFLGKDGGRTAGLCDIQLLVPCNVTARIQEAHKLLFHVLCQWIDEQV